MHGISWSYVKTRKADSLRDGKVRILLQTGLHPRSDLKAVPTVYDLVQSEDVRKVWDLIFTPKLMSRPFVLPPEVPPDRVAALREAFARLVNDPEFLTEMEKIQYEISFVPGAEMDRLIRYVYAFPPEIVARMIDAIGARDKPAGR